MKTYDKIEKVIRYIERHSLEQPRLETLAEVAGLSPFHFQRLFSQWAGTTPKTFLQYLTSQHAKRLLVESKDLLTASMETGLSGPSRLHDLFIAVDGVTPGEFKSGGAGVVIRFGTHDSPFGQILIGSTPRGICHLEFLDGKGHEKRARANLKRRWPGATFSRDDASAARLAKRIFRPQLKGKVSLLLSGTPFQIKVWEALLKIPAGSATTYGRLAKAIDRSGAARAVGTAVANNPIAYLIPCHRVIRSTGVFGDYRWGPRRKKVLLAWEGARHDA